MMSLEHQPLSISGAWNWDPTSEDPQTEPRPGQAAGPRPIPVAGHELPGRGLTLGEASPSGQSKPVGRDPALSPQSQHSQALHPGIQGGLMSTTVHPLYCSDPHSLTGKWPWGAATAGPWLVSFPRETYNRKGCGTQGGWHPSHPPRSPCPGHSPAGGVYLEGDPALLRGLCPAHHAFAKL